MSHLLELLGKGLQHELGDLLDRYFWVPAMETEDELRSALAAHPQRPSLRLQLGLSLLRTGRTPEAIEHLRQCCRLAPDDLGGRVALASAYESDGKAEKALEELRTANQIRPGEPPILFAIAFCLERLQRPRDAREYYRDTVAADGAFPAARERLAAIAVALGDTEEAIEHYQALRTQAPDSAWVRTALAHLYYQAHKHDLAIREFETAIALEPENWSLVDEEVEALAEEGHVREAIERLHQLLDRQGDFPDLHVRLGDLYSQTGNDDAATAEYRAALELSPQYLEALVKLGTHHLMCGRWDQAAEAFHQAGEINESLLESYVGIGVAHAAAGRAGEAFNAFDLAAAIEPNSDLLLTEVTRLQLRGAAAAEFAEAFNADPALPPPPMEEDEEALLQEQIDRHAEEVRLCPDYADLRYRYGVLLRSQGRGADALEQFAKAVELNPTYVRALIRTGILQQELGLNAEAADTFRRVLELRPEYVDIHYRLGLLHTDRGELEEAIRHMQTASDGAPTNDALRASLALSLQNMGLMDRTAATWRSLWRIHHHTKERAASGTNLQPPPRKREAG